jgi:titin
MGQRGLRRSRRRRIVVCLASLVLALVAPGAGQGAPVYASGLTVTNTNDSGPGSLRQAIVDANAQPGLDFISFSIGSGPQTISLQSGLPAISDPAVLDGTTQPGFAGSPIIEINGAAAGVATGINVTAGHSTVRGLVINRFAGHGVDLANLGDDVVEGNFIGTDIAGTAAMGNSGNGIVVDAGISNVRIGGTSPGSRNLISASGDKGIVLVGGSSGTVVQGNVIGTDVTGSIAMPNHFFGVSLESSNGNLIGGAAPGAGNLISGNGISGVNVISGSSGNVVQGNMIGTNRAGNAAIGNGTWGVLVDNASNNAIGGGNVISGNGLDGVLLNGFTTGNRVVGNLIGTDLSGTNALGNGRIGVYVVAASQNTIGGSGQGDGNVISANGLNGINIGGGANLVQGNYVGTDVTGTKALGNNSDGVFIYQSSNNVIGGVSPGARNVISANALNGVNIGGGNTTANVVEGNYIGTTADGLSALGNTLNGVVISAVPGNLVGGTEPGAGNLISGNLNSGVLIYGTSGTGNLVQGNLVGTDRTGEAALANSLFGVVLDGAPGNKIGGEIPADRNVVSGNHLNGILINQASSSGNVVQGNFVGTDATGTRALPNSADGVVISGGSENTIGGPSAGAGNVISGNQGRGVAIFGGASNTVQGNFIGTDANGNLARGNGADGIFMIDTSQNLIGGTTAATRNVISASAGNGIAIVGTSSTANRVQGNYIGTDAFGSDALGNALNGVTIGDVPGNVVGGTDPGAGNLISGNVASGVLIYGAGGRGNLVQGNLVGTDRTGSFALGNGTWGVTLDGATGNIIGGTKPAARNVMSGNRFDGMLIANSASGNLVLGNFVGTDAGGTSPLPNGFNGVAVDGAAVQNTIGGMEAGAANRIAYNPSDGVVVRSGARNAIRGNSIFSNGGLGIDLGDNGVTPNDPGDVDTGPNNLQNFPVITRAVATPVQLLVMGSIDTQNPQAVTIEIFASSVPVPGADATGHGEGQTFLGSVTPNGSGRFTMILPPVPKGTVISATATDAAGNTSEFALDAVAGP